MGDMLQEGFDWLADRLKDHCSREVAYQRDAEQIVVKATIGRTLLQVEDGFGGVRMEWTDRDFLIQAADLVLAGTERLPKRGDRIRDRQGGQVFVFEVMAPGKEPIWRFADPYRKMLRIHTKQVATETI